MLHWFIFELLCFILLWRIFLMRVDYTFTSFRVSVVYLVFGIFILSLSLFLFEQILQEHSDDVWFLQFSRNGKYLASSSNDRSAIIWEVRLIFDRPLSMVVLTRDYQFSYVNYSFSAVIFLLCLFSGFNKLYDFLAFLFYL